MRAMVLLVVLLAPSAAAKVGDPPFVVDVPVTETTERPQAVAVFHATFASRSTEPIELRFEVVRSDGRLLPVEPNPIALGAEGSRTGSATLGLLVQTPYENGRINETGTVMYEIAPHHPETGARLAEPQYVSVVVHTVGTYVPGPPPSMGLAVLVLAPIVKRILEKR